MASHLARGLRLNNPGNIRISNARWAGKVFPSTDRAFETFTTPFYGLRALAKILRTYYLMYGLNTISALIRRWAPPAENDTTSYIGAVGASTGFSVNAPLNLDDAETLLQLVKAIVRHENGSCPFSDDDIRAAVLDALPSTLRKAST